MSDETEVLTDEQEENAEVNGEMVDSEEDAGEPEAVAEVKPKKSEKASVSFIDPTTVEIDDIFNGRHFAPEPAEVNSMETSLREKGQLQPVRIRKTTAAEKKLTGKDWKLLFGFLRARGVLALHEKDPNWRLQAIVVKDVNPQDAFLMNIEENRRRRSTNPIDDSYNISRLMNDFGWDSKRVARFYSWSNSQVSIIKRLKGLDEKVQRKVAKGLLAPADAVKLLKATPEEVNTVVEAISEVESVIDFDPESIPFDDSASNESLQPEVKSSKPKLTPEEQAEETKKTNKRYNNMQKNAKKAGKKAGKEAVKKATGTKSTRSVAELKAALSGREDRSSRAVLKFMSEEWNAMELNTELDEIEEALAETVDA